MNLTLATRRRLLRAAVATDREVDYAAAFEELYQAQSGRIYGFLLYLVRDVDAAEDLTAEVFTRAWARRADLAEPDRIVPWLFRVARNLATEHYRRRRRASVLDERPVPVPSASGSPEDLLLLKERLDAVTRCLETLSDREREVIGLRFLAGLRNREIAGVMRTSEGNVAKIIHRALRRIRERLEQEGGIG